MPRYSTGFDPVNRALRREHRLARELQFLPASGKKPHDMLPFLDRAGIEPPPAGDEIEPGSKLR